MRCQTSKWSLQLTLTSVTRRVIPDTEVTGYSLRGHLRLVFDPTKTWIEGPFVAADVLREDEHPQTTQTEGTPAPL